MNRRWSAAHVVAAVGVFLVATAAGLAGPKGLRQVFQVAAPTVTDQYFARMSWAYPITLAAVGFGLAFAAGIAMGLASERRRRAIDGFAEEHGWVRANVPPWVAGATTPPLAPSAKPQASNVQTGQYRGWTAWSLEVEARFGWKGARAPVDFHVWGLGVAVPAHRVELARRGSVYARTHREGDMRAESALLSVGWVGRDNDADGLAGIHESWALARVLEKAGNVDHVVVGGGAIWTSVTAKGEARAAVQGAFDALVAVAQALALQPSRP